MKKKLIFLRIVSILLCSLLTVSALSMNVSAEDGTGEQMALSESSAVAETSVQQDSKTESASAESMEGKTESAPVERTERKTESAPAEAERTEVKTESASAESTEAEIEPEAAPEDVRPVIRRIIVKPQEKVASYNFYSDTGTLLSSQYVKNGDTLTEPEPPEISGKTFSGWYTKDADGNLQNQFTGFGEVSNISEDVTVNLYAQYKDAVYIYYYDQYGSLIQSRQVQPGSTVQIYNNAPVIQVEPLTQCHDGWALDKDAPVSEDVSGSYTMGTESIRLYPILRNGCWVDFETNGGTQIARQFIDYNASGDARQVKRPDDPQKQGYTFDRWYQDPDLKKEYDFDHHVTQATTLYAGYKPDTDTEYAVRYYVEYQVSDGPEDTLGEGTWDYKFIGKQTKTGTTGEKTEYDQEFIFRAPYNYPVTPYEVNEEKTKPVTIKADGSSVFDVYYQCKRYDLTIQVPDDNHKIIDTLSYKGIKYTASLANMWKKIFRITPEAVVFDGNHRYVYGSENNFVERASDAERMPAESAVWNYSVMSANNSFYNVFLETLKGKAPEGKAVVSNVSLRKEGDQHTYYLDESGSFTSWGNGGLSFYKNMFPGFTPAPQYSDGHYLIYRSGNVSIWFRYHKDWDDVNQLVDADGKGINYWGKDQPLNVYFLRNSYELKFHTDGGEPVQTASVLYEENLAAYEPANYVAGKTMKTVGSQKFVFDGWYTDASYKNELDFSNTMPAYDIDAYAKWKPKTYTVTFDTGAANVKIDPIKNIAYGATIQKPADPKYEGHVFLGWRLNDRPFRFDSGIIGDITLQAEWRSYKAFSITYDLNGGTGTTPTDSGMYYEGAGVPVASADPIIPPEGKVFIGWKSSGDNKVYYPGGIAPMAFGGMKLSAQWADAEKTTQLQYDFNFSTFGISGMQRDSISVDALKNNSRITLAEISSLTDIPDGWTFAGWYLDQNCTDGPYTNVVVDMYNDKAANRVYAKWIRKAAEETTTDHSAGTPDAEPVQPQAAVKTAEGTSGPAEAVLPAVHVTQEERYSSTPDTGDVSPMGLWFLVMVISVTGIFVIVRRIKKNGAGR